MFVHFFDDGIWALDSTGEQGIEGIHSEFNTQSQHFDHVKMQDVRLRQILVNHHIATSPALAGKAPKPPRPPQEGFTCSFFTLLLA